MEFRTSVRAQLFISAAGAGDGGGAAYEAALLSEGRAYVQLAESLRVLDAVILQLHLPERRQELKRQLRVTSLPNTVVLNVAVQNRSRQLALALAAAFAQQCDVRRPARSATVRTVERQADDHECGTAPAVPDLTA
jgi:capsular polysaccharide biosynthesis protein